MLFRRPKQRPEQSGRDLTYFGAEAAAVLREQVRFVDTHRAEGTATTTLQQGVGKIVVEGHKLGRTQQKQRG